MDRISAHGQTCSDGSWSRKGVFGHTWLTSCELFKPYTEKDEQKGIMKPSSVFIGYHCANSYRRCDSEKEEAFKNYRREEATVTVTENEFCSESEESEPEERRRKRRADRIWYHIQSARYWDAHPLDPLKDDADVIRIIRNRTNHFVPFMREQRRRIQ